MSYVLDTNTVSAVMKGDAAVLARLRMTDRSKVFLPQPVIAELAFGIERLPASRRKSELRSRCDLILDELGRIDWTDSVSHAFGAIKAALERDGQRIEDFDIAIAAHAVASTGILVTGNLKHMQRVPGLRVESWSTPTPE